MTEQQIDSLLQLENERPRLEADSFSLELKALLELEADLLELKVVC